MKTIFQKRPKSMVAVNKKLWAACQAWAKRTYDVHPSAYSNSAAVKRYNKMGGKWRKPTAKIKKKAMEINLDIKESDIAPPFSKAEAALLVHRMGIDLDELDTTIDEFLKGINTELEHRFLTHGDPSDTALIAVDHLREDPKYYSKLEKLEGKPEKKSSEDEPSPEDLTLEDELHMIGNLLGVGHDNAIDKLYEILDSDENIKIAKPLGGLGYWHKKEKWVDISRKDKSGKHPPCGREDASKGGKPRCRPASEAAKLTASEKKTESDKKRKVERTKKRKDKKPHMVKFEYMKKKSEGNMNLTKIAADLNAIAASADSKGKEAAAKAVDELTLRLLAISSEIASLPPVAPKTEVSGLVINDGHSISKYEEASDIERAVLNKTLSPKQIVAAVSDYLYKAEMLDQQADLASSGKSMASAIKIAKSAGLIR